MTRATLRFLLLALVLTATPGFAYTVYLKDGSQLVAQRKYDVDGERAIITLPSGTQTAIRLSEIDVERTETANQANLGTAIVIEGGKATDLTQASPPPPKKETLADLIQKRSVSAQGASGSGAPTAESRAPAQRPRISGLEAGAARVPLRNVDLAEAIRSFIFGRGVVSLEVLQGSSARRPLLVYSTSSEGQVFKAILASANALVFIRDQRPGEVEGFDLVCDAPSEGRGGEFRLTPELAADLVSGRLDVPTFFVQHVQF